MILYKYCLILGIFGFKISVLFLFWIIYDGFCFVKFELCSSVNWFLIDVVELFVIW